MSVSLILVPLAVAAAAAASGARAGRDANGQVICQVQTRMRDQALLAAALRETGAVVTDSAAEVTADWQGVRSVFHRGEDGIWTAHFTGAVDQARAVQIVAAVDTAYGRQVQRAVLDRLRQNAPAAGLRLTSEQVTGDESVQLVFTVQERSA